MASAKRTTMSAFDVCIITTIHPPFEARIWARGVLPLLDAGLLVRMISGWRIDGDPTGTGRFSSMRVRPPVSRGGRVLYTTKVFFRATRCRARVYHFHDLDFLPFAVLLKMITGAHVIYDCHENYHLQVKNDKPWIPRSLRSGLSRAVDALERWSVRVLRLCIVTLPEWEQRFRHPGVTVVTVRNRTAWAPARNLPHGQHIVYSGSIGVNYGVNVLLGIAREIKKRGLPTRVFITLKNAASRDQDSILDSIESEQLPIVIHKQVSADRIGDFLSLGRIGLSIEQNTPEKRRAVPGKLFEYMAFGLPIVSSDIPNNRNIIEQAGCGLVVPAAEPAAYVDAIQRILGDGQMLTRFRENGFRAVETVFSWKREKDALIGLYRQLLRCPLGGS